MPLAVPPLAHGRGQDLHVVQVLSADQESAIAPMYAGERLSRTPPNLRQRVLAIFLVQKSLNRQIIGQNPDTALRQSWVRLAAQQVRWHLRRWR